MRYIQHKNDRYIINKNINGQTIYCGSYTSLKEAVQVRDYLIVYNWNTDLIEALKEKDMKYIYKQGDYYRIMKSIGNELVYFGVYYFLSVALLERCLLMLNNWDIDDI